MQLRESFETNPNEQISEACAKLQILIPATASHFNLLIFPRAPDFFANEFL